MKSFKADLMEAVSLISNIERDLKINTLNANEKIIFYSILLKEKKSKECIISDVIHASKLSRSTVFKILKKLQDINLISFKQSSIDKRELLINVNL
jgi:DNA-binding MarR family transcriptional regulator